MEINEDVFDDTASHLIDWIVFGLSINDEGATCEDLLSDWYEYKEIPITWEYNENDGSFSRVVYSSDLDEIYAAYFVEKREYCCRNRIEFTESA